MTDSAAALPRDPSLALARLHLRLGSLVQARAELEVLAGNGALDDEGLVDLAEARWRTGDLSGAGDAARHALDAGRTDVMAYVVAAEALADAGRPGEARRLASHALEASGLDIDALFAGMPRAGVWPADPNEQPTVTGLFEEVVIPLPVVGPQGPAVPAARSAAIRSLWDDAPAEPLPEPATSLAEGRAALEAGDRRTAALHLALAIRLAPALAPAVLELVQSVDEPELALLRGDAFRLVGHERDARLAFASAAAAISDTAAVSDTAATFDIPAATDMADAADAHLKEES